MHFWFKLANLALLALLAYLAATNAASAAVLTVVLIAAVLAGFLGFIDRIESIRASGSGFEARTRDVVRRAEAALSELQQVTSLLATVLVEVIDSAGRYGGATTPAERDDRKSKLRALLLSIGLTEAAAQTAILEGERHWVLFDYANAVRRPIGKGTPAEEAFWGSLNNRLENLSTEALRDIIGDLPGAHWRLALLDDYDHYQATGSHRRPEVWRMRGEWPYWTRDDAWPV